MYEITEEKKEERKERRRSNTHFWDLAQPTYKMDWEEKNGLYLHICIHIYIYMYM
jgi:hypothetical protein